MPDDESGGRAHDCPVCDEVATGPTCRADLAALHRTGTLAEALVDSFGFCLEDAFAFTAAGEQVGWPRIALGGAATRIATMLRSRMRTEEEWQATFFELATKCPGCLARHRRAARAINLLVTRDRWLAEAARSCSAHYRDLVYALPANALVPLARRRVDYLQARGAVPQPCAGPESFEPSTCVVCAAMAAAEARWLDDVGEGARLGTDVWIVFPTCGRHRACCAALDPMVANATSAHVREREIEGLTRGIERVAYDNAARDEARRSVFYRRQSAGWILGRQRRMMTERLSCPGCERLIVAREKATNALVARLRSAPEEAEGAVRSLCLKHFAVTWLLLAPGEARARLAALEAAELDAIAHRYGEPVSDCLDDAAGWRTAVARFASKIVA